MNRASNLWWLGSLFSSDFHHNLSQGNHSNSKKKLNNSKEINFLDNSGIIGLFGVWGMKGEIYKGPSKFFNHTSQSSHTSRTVIYGHI